MALNVTITSAAGSGFVTVYPSGTARPVASNLNFVVGATVANQALIKVGSQGRVTVYSSQRTHVVIDVAGYYPTAGQNYSALNPSRILDTRSGLGASTGPVAAGGRIDLQVSGRGGVPADSVGTVILNLTATGPQSSGYATTFPTGVPRPTASNLNYVRGQTVAALVFAKLGAGGKVSVYTSGSAHLVADVAGYMPTEADYTGITPARLVDTRSGLGAPRGALPAGKVLTVKLAGAAGIPTDQVTAVSLNITVTQSSGGGFVTVFPVGQTRPTASMLNFRRGQTIANSMLAKPGTDGSIALYASATAHIVVDAAGYISAPLNVDMEQPASTHLEEPGTVTAVDAPSAVGEHGSYILDAGQTAPPVGDHVFLPPGGDNGDGLIGKVTGSTGNSVDVVGVPLEAAFPEGHIEGTGSQDNALIEAATARVHEKQRSAKPLDCKGSGGGPAVAVNFEQALRFAVDADWGAGKRSHIRVLMTTSAAVEFSVDVSAKVSCSLELPSAKGPMVGPFTTSIGPKLAFEVSAGIKAGARWEGITHSAGFDWYIGSTPTTLSSFSKGGWTVTAPNIRSVNVRAELSAGPAVEMKLLGMAGPEFFIAVFAAETFTPAANPWWSITGGLKFKASLEIDVLFLLHAEYEIAEKPLVELTLATSTGPYLGPQPPIPTQLSILTTAVPAGAEDLPYTASLSAIGGTPPYSWSSTGLPAGLHLDEESGIMSGTPTTRGNYSPTMTVTDSDGDRISRTLSLTIAAAVPPLTVQDFALKPGTVGVTQQWYLPSWAYGEGGGTVTSWTVRASSLPPGLTLASGEELCGSPDCGWALVGTPTQPGTSEIDLTANGEKGNSATLTRRLIVSGQPGPTSFQRVDQLPATFDIYRDVNDQDHYTIIRRSRATGETVDVLQQANAPTACRTGGITFDSRIISSANGRFTMFSCVDERWHLYLADVGDAATAGSTRRLDVAQDGYTPKVSAGSSFQGDVNDDGDAVFVTQADLTAPAAAEASSRTQEHAYVIDPRSDKIQFLPMTGFRWQAFRSAKISRNGNYVAQLGLECSGPTGGFCGEGQVLAQANPFHPDAVTCTFGCTFVGTYWGVDLLTMSDDGLTMLLREDVPDVKANHTYTNGDQLAVWHVGGQITRLPRWDTGNGSMGYPWVSGALSPDGSRIYYTDNLKPFTCDVMRADVLPTSLGAPTPVDTPPNGLPRTGCSRPLRVELNGDVYFDSTNTNLFPSAFGTPTEDVEGILRLPAR